MKIPLVIASSLWHVGDLDNNTQGRRESQEGNLLSVSACPNAWSSIARLGGGKFYELGGETMLLNMGEALTDPAYEHLRLEVQRWGQARGYIESGLMYVMQFEDCEADEGDELRESYFHTEEEALLEAESCDGRVEARELFLATPKLLSMHHLRSDCANWGMEFALIEWARENMQQSMIRGVYWDGRLDPLSLIAPRAGLFSARGLSIRNFLPDDDECLAGLDYLTMESYELKARRVREEEGLTP